MTEKELTNCGNASDDDEEDENIMDGIFKCRLGIFKGCRVRKLTFVSEDSNPYGLPDPRPLGGDEAEDEWEWKKVY